MAAWTIFACGFFVFVFFVSPFSLALHKYNSFLGLSELDLFSSSSILHELFLFLSMLLNYTQVSISASDLSPKH